MEERFTKQSPITTHSYQALSDKSIWRACVDFDMPTEMSKLIACGKYNHELTLNNIRKLDQGTGK